MHPPGDLRIQKGSGRLRKKEIRLVLLTQTAAAAPPLFPPAGQSWESRQIPALGPPVAPDPTALILPVAVYPCCQSSAGFLRAPESRISWGDWTTEIQGDPPNPVTACEPREIAQEGNKLTLSAAQIMENRRLGGLENEAGKPFPHRPNPCRAGKHEIAARPETGTAGNQLSE